MSKAYAEVIGDPIAHSKSPLIHNFWLEKLGIDAEYRACHVRPDELADYLSRRRGDTRWRGCNVTIPHKEAIARLVDELAPAASAVGAVNAVVRKGDANLFGTNTDVDGVAEAIAGIELARRHAVVIGGGGAARAAFACLADAGCASVTVLARTIGKASRAAEECGLSAKVEPFAADSGVIGGASLVINATQLGMVGQDPMPDFVLRELAAMQPGGLVFDMVYAPLETELLKTAGRLGIGTADGLTMLIGQAATAFAHFFGVAAPRDCDGELRGMLVQ
ncbi:MAG: shikimate dehydrogenase [Novosphingobium sp.]|nr:shikimate dehydrogenase [Novosphingobium sp.]MCP5402028.1 shikimate dehydrogenase [Novosphingobium sp.]